MIVTYTVIERFVEADENSGSTFARPFRKLIGGQAGCALAQTAANSGKINLRFKENSGADIHAQFGILGMLRGPTFR